MKKRFWVFLAIFSLFVCTPVYAEEGDEETTTEETSNEPEFHDENYWTNLCTSGQTLSLEEKSQCSAYMQHMSAQSDNLREQLQAIENQRARIAADIATYAAQVRNYQAQADALNGDIAKLNGEIAVMEKEIEMTEEEMERKQDEIDQAKQKIKDRMVNAQGTMRLNPFLDILMGASSFENFIRIANGITDITSYDEKVMEDLADDIEELNQIKIKLEEDKEKLDEAKEELVTKQNEILTLKYQAEVIEQEFRKQSADLEAQGNRIASDIAAITELMREITEQLNTVVATAGWSTPVPGGRKSAGTWYYDGGGVHLGEDIAASRGTSIRAVGNGVILKSADGCGDGYLGNWCAGAPGGSAGGGNQVYLLTKINGGLYAVKYIHMLQGTPIAKGTIVMAGDYIGQVGTSGNSTGPHCHIEVFYLGSESNFTNYAQNWNGDLAFGCGWGTAALSRLCENGVGAPCRVKPETLFG